MVYYSIKLILSKHNLFKLFIPGFLCFVLISQAVTNNKSRKYYDGLFYSTIDFGANTMITNDQGNIRGSHVVIDLSSLRLMTDEEEEQQQQQEVTATTQTRLVALADSNATMTATTISAVATSHVSDSTESNLVVC